jgi:hypothetical protein
MRPPVRNLVATGVGHGEPPGPDPVVVRSVVSKTNRRRGRSSKPYRPVDADNARRAREAPARQLATKSGGSCVRAG